MFDETLTSLVRARGMGRDEGKVGVANPWARSGGRIAAGAAVSTVMTSVGGQSVPPSPHC